MKTYGQYRHVGPSGSSSSLLWNWPSVPRRRVRPIGFCPGQRRAAADSLTIAENPGWSPHARDPAPLKGSWWGHPKGGQIFRLCEALDESDEVLTFKLVGGKVTYVHRRLWPALVKLAARFERAQLAVVWSEHTPSGAHRARREPFPRRVPPEVRREAHALSVTDAEEILAPLLAASGRRGTRFRPTPGSAP